MKVYILSSYEEHGAFHVVATLDRDKIIPLIQKFSDLFPDEILREAVNTVIKYLNLPEPEGGAMGDLTKGWGGIQLHVVELS